MQVAAEWTERQGDVLDTVLRLVAADRPLTMGEVAREASCSKETLYKWFGDRDGLLTAAVRRQAARVRGAPLPDGEPSRAALLRSLARFAADWLTVLGGSTSVALNRLAVSHARGEEGGLGAIVLQNGPRAMVARLRPLIEAGRAAGLLAFDDPEDAARVFFGLVVRDTQIRLLLGEALGLDEPTVERDARRAAESFLALFAASPAGAASRPNS